MITIQQLSSIGLPIKKLWGCNSPIFKLQKLDFVMGINLKQCLEGISLNLKIKFVPYYDKTFNINGGEYRALDMDNNESEVTTFKLTQMEGCSGICISSKVSISDEYKGKGYGSKFNHFREVLAKQMGYSSIMCTIVKGNIPQEKILTKNGWEVVNVFVNSKTGNTIEVYFKKL